MDTGELSRLEEYVDKLLEKYHKLRGKCEDLITNLEEQKDKTLMLEQEISDLKSNRSEMGSRLSGLLSRIERWEIEEEELTAASETTELEDQDSACDGDDPDDHDNEGDPDAQENHYGMYDANDSEDQDTGYDKEPGGIHGDMILPDGDAV